MPDSCLPCLEPHSLSYCQGEQTARAQSIGSSIGLGQRQVTTHTTPPTTLLTMCQYTYCYYYCGCSTYLQNDTIEYCANRKLNAHGPDIWSDDMCDKKEVKCAGISNYYCTECSEDYTLEYSLEE